MVLFVYTADNKSGEDLAAAMGSAEMKKSSVVGPEVK